MKKALTILILLVCNYAHAQLYFPPATGTAWDTLSPSSLGWCQDRIDSLYSYLDSRNTDGFIVLKDGKIVLEKYFGTFTADSVHYWASASKSLTAMLTGIAQEQGLLHISDLVSNSIGTGWTTAPLAKENLITIRHLLTMTSGLNDTVAAPCTNDDTSAGCLRYLADAGSRWAYHTGAYRKLQAVITAVSGLNYNTFTANNIGNITGMTGLWYNGVFYSKPRSMARFGLLSLNRGVWGPDTILHDTAYFNAMVNTSQSFNPAYGYLWWLNGKTTFISPGSQYVFSGALMPNGPTDMFCALGKDDQKIYVVPSRNMVIIRTGASAYGVALAFSPFDDELWGKIDSLGYGCSTGVSTTSERDMQISIYPNPANHIVNISLPGQRFSMDIYEPTGRLIYHNANNNGNSAADCSSFAPGIYIVIITTSNNKVIRSKLIVE